MKFKTGDKVYVRKDLEEKAYTSKDSGKKLDATSGMVKLAGKKVTILKINDCGHYRIKEDDGRWCWSDEMLQETFKFKIGDKVRILDGSTIKNYTCGWNSDMEKYVGKIATISYIGSLGYGDKTFYRMKEFGFNWDECGLAPVCDEKIIITTDGKTTTAKLIRDKNVVKTAEAKCSPDDAFNFETGAKLAFERLTYSGFKIGDRVVAKKGAPYSITTDGWEGTITNIFKPDSLGKDITVDGYGGRFDVESEYFDLAIEKPKLYNGKVVCIDNTDNPNIYTVGKIYQFNDGVMISDRGAKISTLGRGFTSFAHFSRWTSSKFIEVKE